MTQENPYQTSKCLPSQRAHDCRRVPSNKVLWRAYFWAPAVAPITFVAIVLVVGLVAPLLGVEINPASMLVLPAIALTVGVASCYVVAGVIGMPIAFYLRRIRLLNGYSIHAAAFCWAALFSGFCAIVMVGQNRSELPLAICYFGVGVIPPVLLSGTTFWLLLNRFSSSETAM